MRFKTMNQDFTAILHIRKENDTGDTMDLFDMLAAILDSHGFRNQYAITCTVGAPTEQHLSEMGDCTLEKVTLDLEQKEEEDLCCR